MIEMYGIKTAKLCGLPLEVIEDAEQIYRHLAQHANRASVVEDGSIASTGTRRLIHQLLALRFNDLDNAGMSVLIERFSHRLVH